MGKALYRTNRPQRFAEIVGQEHITRTLETALAKGLISHAYLFTGPHGVGKTSIARILAHEINNLPYDDDSMHLDIIEIDAASNRRIDEIRDLRDKVHIAPTSAKYKVYIIDEVHMLTREAFNALLKTLEEPPAHVVFILATTEVHKLPETIISRTQRFTFRPISPDVAATLLQAIAKKEGLEIDDDALHLIATHGGGSLRDSTSILDQMRSLGRKVGTHDVELLLGIAPSERIAELLSSLEHHDALQLIATLDKLQEQGTRATQTAKQLGSLLRERLITNKSSMPHEQIIALLTKLLDVPDASDPAVFLQIILLDIALAGQSGPLAKDTPRKAPTATSTPPPTTPKAIKRPAEAKVSAPAITQSPTTAGPDDYVIDAAMWPKVLMTIKQQYNTLYSILRTAQPRFTPGAVVLEVAFSFHQKRLNEVRNKKVLGETIEQVTGHNPQITCKVVARETKTSAQELGPEEQEIVQAVAGESESKTKTTTQESHGDSFDYYVSQAEEASARPLDTVSTIFGGGELLES